MLPQQGQQEICLNFFIAISEKKILITSRFGHVAFPVAKPPDRLFFLCTISIFSRSGIQAQFIS
jgi:hypothetical protein